MRWPLEHYEPIKTAIGNRRPLVVQNQSPGNWGDSMIEAATNDILDRLGIRFGAVAEDTLTQAFVDQYDVLLLYGSGSVGKLCGNVVKRRQKIRELGKPCILLPSTAFDSCEDLSWCETIFMREEVSHAMYSAVHPRCELVPDMAMGWELPDPPSETPFRAGTFLREDSASLGLDISRNRGDPINHAKSARGYAMLASCYQRITTDRLHFAIAGLLHDKQVNFVPMRWHKLRAMYITWFKNLPNANWLVNP